mmetsp:Transcript_45696/g.118114  ORF Transcript_45696/g.118114 Transcript_45696/m.118114 type:complete len:342 (-) Transcript_45696:504-1529(-)
MGREDREDPDWVKEVEKKGYEVYCILENEDETVRSETLSQLYRQLHHLALKAKRDESDYAAALAHKYQAVCIENLPQGSLLGEDGGEEQSKSRKPTEVTAKAAEHRSQAGYLAKGEIEKALLTATHISSDVYQLAHDCFVGAITLYSDLGAHSQVFNHQAAFLNVLFDCNKYEHACKYVKDIISSGNLNLLSMNLLWGCIITFLKADQYEDIPPVASALFDSIAFVSNPSLNIVRRIIVAVSLFFVDYAGSDEESGRKWREVLEDIPSLYEKTMISEREPIPDEDDAEDLVDFVKHFIAHLNEVRSSQGHASIVSFLRSDTLCHTTVSTSHYPLSPSLRLA